MGQYRSSFDDVYNESAVSISANTLTLTAAHINQTLYADGSGAQTYTTPATADTTIPIGSKFRFVRNANQTLTVAAGSGCTIVTAGASATARARYSEIVLTRISATTWRLGGDVATS